MAAYRTLLRHAPLASRSIQSRPVRATLQCSRYASSSGGGRGKRGGVGRFVGGLLVALAAGGAVLMYPAMTKEPPKNTIREAVIEYEQPRALPATKEDSRDLISSQHLQVKKSWEHPGVYCWGSNSGRVAAPDSTESVIKTPRRISYFDDQLIRDIKLDKEFGAAITERGDLVQWGTGFSKDNPTPRPTLKGKDLVRLEISKDRIIALGKDGSVYSLPVAQADQSTSGKPTSSSWSFWSSPSNVNYRQVKPNGLGWGERVTSIAGGLEHVLLLTSKGRVFSAASSTTSFPSQGQLGIPGLNWHTRPQGPFDQPHEILTLKGFNITQIAAGDYHSLALEKDGRVFVFGDNSSGQLGFEPENEIPFVDGPIPLPFSKMYRGTHQKPRVTSIAAGGANSFFTVDATRIARPNEDEREIRDIGHVTSDVWSCGSGIWGTLGNSRWTHVSLGPTKIKSFSGLSEYDEKTKSVVPIRLAYFSVGSTHAAAVMNNVTNVDASDRTSDQDTNWGADVLWWGGNESYQLGTGKRNNVATPMYIGPLDGGRGDAEKGRENEMHRFQIAPRATVRLGEGGKGRKATVEQRVECGRLVSCVYSSP
ncbi:regulator of chromosome condensation 1/beta-lactamase-inhibitor protein II [Xylaria bambusicola]|uniref:regulator of chromosome condensation 1/beta-lactamase-inhibitor protein II n=1 Tax=Xylaria bambusicola TaxID=326684 RepID=UPI00200781D5|nr:regulator of chromosome condensation 1/beta-lactamase-inhibitor protein II [Xylaria bambusicola]KAI0517863.1 regulator of chromosome condensation 1/beta-lactamase-inhibitor protein II [Xylaria bambusicola]